MRLRRLALVAATLLIGGFLVLSTLPVETTSSWSVRLGGAEEVVTASPQVGGEVTGMDELQRRLDRVKNGPPKPTLEVDPLVFEDPNPNGYVRGSPEHVKSLYRGCFQDAFGQRDLPQHIPLFQVTPLTCSHACRSFGFRFAGLQAGSECWCGPSFGTYDKSTDCNVPCVFEPSETCGGKFANDIYSATYMPHATALGVETVFNFPDSHVSCTITPTNERLCSVENLYYLSDSRRFVVQIGPTSRVKGATLRPGDIFDSFVESNSVEEVHPMALMCVETVTEFMRTERRVRRFLVAGRSFVISRFLPYNIMHVLHDDLVGLFYTMASFAANPPSGQEPNPAHPFPLDSTIFLTDDHGAGAYVQLLQLFSEKPLLHRHQVPPESIVRFEWASIGMSRRANWYQYGFKGPQGPIPNKPVSGLAVRRVADFIKANLRLEPTMRGDTIVIFSRRSNRLIMNEKELATALETEQTQPVVFARLEEMTIRQIIELMTHTSTAIGMHGSILILTMFMPPGGRVIEMYPYGVPPMGYTPYRTLAHLPGMDLHYDAWANTNFTASVGHPDRQRLLGGISHLHATEQLRIINLTTVPTHKCCEDPVWLYKIYQDTFVDIPQVLSILRQLPTTHPAP